MNRLQYEQNKLKCLQEQINLVKQNYERINYGGCGTFSYYVSEILDKYNIKNQIVFLEEKETPIGAFRCDIKFTHILIKTEYCFIDIGGFYPLESSEMDWLKLLKPMPKDKLAEMLLESRLWNDTFGSEKRDLLAKDLLKIEIK